MGTLEIYIFKERYFLKCFPEPLTECKIGELLVTLANYDEKHIEKTLNEIKLLADAGILTSGAKFFSDIDKIKNKLLSTFSLPLASVIYGIMQEDVYDIVEGVADVHERLPDLIEYAKSWISLGRDTLKEYANNGKADISRLIKCGEVQKIEYEIKALSKDEIKDAPPLLPCYTIIDLYSLIIFELVNIIENNIQVKYCANCKKLFIPPKRSDTLYCDNISPQNKDLTCKEYSQKRLWYDRTQSDEIKRFARNTYMKLQMAATRNKDIQEYKETFENFQSEYRKWKIDIKKGLTTEEEFKKWLEFINKKGGKPNVKKD